MIRRARNSTRPIQSKNELAVFDAAAAARTGAYPLSGCQHPHGLAIPPGTSIGYVACDENDVLVTVDLKTGKELSHLPLGHDPDVLAMDGTAKRLYVASESGNLSAFDIANPAAPVSLGDSFVGRNAHSVAVDPANPSALFAAGGCGRQVHDADHRAKTLSSAQH